MGLADGEAWEREYGWMEKAKMGDHYGRHEIEADRRTESTMSPEHRAHNKAQDEQIARLSAEVRALKAASEHKKALIADAKTMLERAAAVLAPLVAIADAYDDNALDDEARKFWGHELQEMNTTPPEKIELYTGRGGKRLLTLADCFAARDLVRGAGK